MDLLCDLFAGHSGVSWETKNQAGTGVFGHGKQLMSSIFSVFLWQIFDF